MRRSTPGVVGAEDLMDGGVARAEAHDPRRVVEVLEPMVGEARRARLREVIGRRLASVAVVFDGPYDPHNGAAVLRSCEAFGVQRLHVVERPGAPFTVARTVARGAQNWLDVTCHEAAPSLLAWAREAGMPLAGAHPQGELLPEALAELPRVAIVLGNEREGMREAIAAACTAPRPGAHARVRREPQRQRHGGHPPSCRHARASGRPRRGRAPPALCARPLSHRASGRADPGGGGPVVAGSRVAVATRLCSP